MYYNKKNPYVGYVETYVTNVRELPYNTQIIAENLIVPWSGALREDGILYVTERPGQIRIIEDGVLLPQPLFVFDAPFASAGEGGLLGIALDPDFMENHYLYVMHTYTEDNKLFNRVVRLKEDQNSAVIDRVLIDRIPGGLIHNGGKIMIGPDNKLYITTGDAGNAALAQDLDSLAGKILRISLDGSIPEDNPFPGSPVYSLGHRNSQGLAWGPDQTLYSSEHGSQGNDEINIIIAGGNYGWPLVQGDEETGGMVVQKPLLYSGEVTWAPSGIAYIKEGPWSGKLLVATLTGEELLLLSLNEENEVEQVEAFLKNEFGRIREVVEAEDGSIYLLTSNLDGRGNPDATDDKVIRLIPENLS